MEYRNRQEKLQEAIAQQGWSGFLVTHNVDLYYYCGSMQNGYLFVPAQGEPVFYVKRSVSRARFEAQIQVKPLGSFRQFGKLLMQDFPQCFEGKVVSIATEFDVLPVQIYLRLQSILPVVKWEDGSAIVRRQRMIKSGAEIACIRRCAEVVNRALLRSLERVQVGMRDVDLMRMIESEVRAEGHAGLMRMRGYNQELITGMVASGSDAAVPTYFDGPAGGLGLSAASPQGSGVKCIERNEPILIDIGCCIEGYIIDQTRMAVIGTLADHLGQAYQLSVDIEEKIQHQLKPGIVCEQLYTESLQMAADGGLAHHYMGFGDDQVKFLGHGIGLEIDEWPVLTHGFNDPLSAGMVIAIEPKFSFPNEGVVGIEDSYLITEQGYDRLTVTEQKLFEL